MTVDPLEISRIADLIDAKSWPKYSRYWTMFCSTMEISKEKPPTHELILEFMKICKNKHEYAPTTLWTVFSCLNKFCQHKYDMTLNVSFLLYVFLHTMFVK